MAALGAIGTNDATSPSAGDLLGEPWHYDPFNTAIGTKNQDAVGPEPAPGGYFGGGTPVFLITTIVANYGQSGGGVSIF